MILSILICHLAGRAAELVELLDVLQPQVSAYGDAVEIIIETDIGQATIGAKRNRLLDKAQGEYVAFVDDDDLVSEDYVERILAALEHRPACVGIEGVYTQGRQRGRPRRFVHSIRYDRWYSEGTGDAEVFYRPPNHLNPVARDLAATVRFADRSHGEDHDYSMRLRPLLQSEQFVEGPMYFYRAETCR